MSRVSQAFDGASDLIDRLKAERTELRDACLNLAAPLCWATDGSNWSAVHHITSYVKKLEGELESWKTDCLYWAGTASCVCEERDALKDENRTLRAMLHEARNAPEPVKSLRLPESSHDPRGYRRTPGPAAKVSTTEAGPGFNPPATSVDQQTGNVESGGTGYRVTADAETGTLTVTPLEPVND